MQTANLVLCLGHQSQWLVLIRLFRRGHRAEHGAFGDRESGNCTRAFGATALPAAGGLAPHTLGWRRTLPVERSSAESRHQAGGWLSSKCLLIHVGLSMPGPHQSTPGS